MRYGGAWQGVALLGEVGFGVVWRGRVRYGLVSLARNFYAVRLGEVR